MSYLIAIVMILAMADSKPELEPWQTPQPPGYAEYVDPQEWLNCTNKVMTRIELNKVQWND